MLFNTIKFFAFFAVVLMAYYAAPKRWGKAILLISSYYFYMCWNPIFILLLMALTVIDFVAGQLIEVVRPQRKKFALLMSLVANLGFLGFFKYYNFLASTLATLMRKPENSFFLAIVLPVGISFHTFQSMSYVVDVYYGRQKAIRNALDYALYIAFWPQLVAGPIVRARDFFRDLFGRNLRAFASRLSPLSIPATFLMVCFGWVFFRAANLHDSIFVLQQMFGHTPGVWLLKNWHIWMIALSFILAALEERWEVFERLPKTPKWAFVCTIVAFLFCLEIFSAIDEKIPFIYFQF
jgi:D-alanyl-lipoteichoic acid acyltransferase DltB (MBOAT superfamily)